MCDYNYYSPIFLKYWVQDQGFEVTLDIRNCFMQSVKYSGNKFCGPVLGQNLKKIDKHQVKICVICFAAFAREFADLPL